MVQFNQSFNLHLSLHHASNHELLSSCSNMKVYVALPPPPEKTKQNRGKTNIQESEGKKKWGEIFVLYDLTD